MSLYDVLVIGPDFERPVLTTEDFEEAIKAVHRQRQLTRYAVVVRDKADDRRWCFNELPKRRDEKLREAGIKARPLLNELRETDDCLYDLAATAINTGTDSTLAENK